MKLGTRSRERARLHCTLSPIPLALVLLLGQRALAAEYYVATTGQDTNLGTIDEPFATLQKAVGVAKAGDTVWIRGGTYKVTTPASSMGGILFNKSGTSDDNRIRYWAYADEIPVFDFSELKISTTGYTMGFYVTGSWLHFKGLEICNVPMNQFSNNGISVDGGGHDIFELLDMHHNNGNGIFIGKGAGGHLVLNCDAHDNYDPGSNQGDGQNADGFGVHYQTSGDVTTLRGCRAWWNSDDGYDLINQEVPVIVENSWAMGSGYANYGTKTPSSGNGAGFKMGSSKTGVRHIVRGNVAWKNKAHGFYANHSSGGNTWYNNTSFNNGTQFNMLASPPDDPNTTITLSGDKVHIMRNNLGFPNKNSNMTGVDSAFNAWDLNLIPANKDFASVSDPSVSGTGASIEESGALGPREPDGSLPKIDFLQLAAGSQMIDKGTDVGLPFVGDAPDLGAYEFGANGAGGGVGIDAGIGSGGRAGTGGVGGVAGTGGSGGRGSVGGASGAGGATTVVRTSAAGGSARAGAAGGGGEIGSGGAGPAGRGGGLAAGGTGAGGALGAGGLGSTSLVGSGGLSSTSGSSTTPQATSEAGGNGCSCRVAGADTSVRTGLPMLALVLLAVWRRRSR